MKFLTLSPCLLLLCACSYTPANYQAATQLNLPERLQTAAPATALSIDRQWWEAFHTEELDALMGKLAQRNLTIVEAELALSRAKLLLRQSQADNTPFVSASVSGRSNRDVESGTSQNGVSAGISVGYEVDIWGSRDAEQLARQLDINIAEYQQHSIALQVQSLLATAYFNYLSLQRRQEIVQQNVDASQRLLDLVELIYEAGDASGIEVSQQRNTLISSQAELLNINNQLALSQRVIAVLLGDNQMSAIDVDRLITSIALPEIDLVQPAALLRSRPDVKLAATQLQQADIYLYQAGIQGLPGLNLSADVSASDLLDLASGWTISALANSAATLFDGGRIEAGERIAEVDIQLALNSYRQITLGAVQELLDSLDTYGYQKAAYLLDMASLENNERLYRLAEIRYKAGDTDFLNLLSAQRSWFSAQLAVINSYNSALTTAVDVYRAAGGRPQLSATP
ncbi:TolC family protein [Alteromonas pelagimontana]|uniref:TolC family protein n=1 Tax=Alteromonas pelagimontana TaxID=1858656 RepID=A0A6M4MBX5_9ALTE|nr:TolC family protein [Alteromonas pelagimontana]QJR80529.1 TolC family protein [Alteromonas pelagimontana]